MAEYQNKLESAADALARKQLGLEPKKDEAIEQERLPELLESVKQKYLDVLDEAFKDVCGQIKLKLGVKNLSDDIMLMIANKINDKAISGDLRFVSDFSQDKEIAAVVENATVLQQQQIETTRAIEEENIENAKKDFPSPVIAAAMVGAAITAENLAEAVRKSMETGIIDMGNGNILKIEEPEDEKYAFTSKESEEEEHEIENLVGSINEYREIAAKDPSRIPELMENLKKSLGASKYGIGADVILTYFTEQKGIDGPEFEFNDALLQVMVDERTKPDSKFRPDSFTAEKDLKLISTIFKMNDSDPHKTQYLDYFRAVNPQMVELVEKNPRLYDALYEKYGANLSIEIFEGSDAHSESEMMEIFEEFARENPELVKKQEVKGQDVQEQESEEPREEQEAERDEVERDEIVEEKEEEKLPEQPAKKPEITADQKAENYKKALMNMAKVKGVAFALKFANNSIEKGNDKELLTSVVVDVLSTEEFLQSAKAEDIPVIKELIGGCLDEQNKKSNAQLIEYVQALGGAVKDIKERTAERPEVEVIDVEEPTTPKKEVDEGPEL